MSELATDTTLPRFRVEAVACGRTEVGPTRSENQDAIMVASAVGAVSGTRLSWAGEVPEAGVTVAVIDGMGGYAGGSDAALLAASALASVDLSMDPSAWDRWFERLSDRITHAGQAWGTPEMGATAALVAVTPIGLLMANVGDCRIYRVIGGHLGQLSVDDRTDDPDASTVTQALGGFTRIDSHAYPQPLRGGPERYVLCSDGVWGALDPAVLRDLCTAERPPAQIVDAVVASIYAQHATDNCSIIVIDLTATPADSPAGSSHATFAAWQVTVEHTPEKRTPAP